METWFVPLVAAVGGWGVAMGAEWWRARWARDRADEDRQWARQRAIEDRQAAHEDRHREYQRSTLLELQDVLSDFGRSVGHAHYLDVKAGRTTGTYGRSRFPDEVAEELNTRHRRAIVLKSRVEDEAARLLAGDCIEHGMNTLGVKSEAEAVALFTQALADFGAVNDRIGQLLRGEEQQA